MHGIAWPHIPALLIRPGSDRGIIEQPAHALPGLPTAVPILPAGTVGKAAAVQGVCGWARCTGTRGSQAVMWTRTNGGTKGTMSKIDRRACFTCIWRGSSEPSAAAAPVALLFIWAACMHMHARTCMHTHACMRVQTETHSVYAGELPATSQ